MNLLVGMGIFSHKNRKFAALNLKGKMREIFGKRGFIFLFINFLYFFVAAQGGGLRGFVYDKQTGEPMAYALIQLKGTNYGQMTQPNGAFMITRVPAGVYEVEVSYMGYQTLVENITIEDKLIAKNFNLDADRTQLDGVNITAESQRVLTETRTSVITVSSKDIKQMPAIGGSPDFAQYLQVVPGVISTGDQGGQLYIRGGTPIQNMLMLDGMLIYNPFHSIGLFSVFDSELISTADVYTGGFGAEFGGRLSSVMDIRTRDGNRKRLSGRVDVNTFGAKMLLEGPFVKMKDNNAFSLGYILSVKGSYLQYSSKGLYPYIEGGLPYNYFDVYGKVSLTGKSGSKVNLFGFRFDDKVNYSDIATYRWTNWGAGANFLVIPGKTSMMIEGTVGYTNYYTALDDKANKPVLNNTSDKDTNTRQSALNGFVANLKFSYFLGKSQLSLGVEFSGNTVRYVFFPTPAASSHTVFRTFTTDVGLYVKYKYNYRDKVLVEPSFRLQYYASIGKASPEPRLSFKYNITPKIRLKLAGGLFSQNLLSATSDRDVVNLFSGFLAGDDNTSLPDTLPTGKAAKSAMQQSQHVILGLELDVIPYTTINIEGYYKNFAVLTSVNRYKMFDEEDDYMFENGNAYGADFSADFSYKGINIKFVYALGWVNRFDGNMHYKPHFDRRHNINLLASYSFGKRKSWQVDLRWNFGTGFPYTQTQAYIPMLDIPAYNVDYVTANESLDFMLAEYNGGRLPSYHRLDFSVKKTFHIGDRHVIEVSVGATNLYNYKNVFYRDRMTNKTIYQLPLLYSLGFSWQF